MSRRRPSVLTNSISASHFWRPAMRRARPSTRTCPATSRSGASISPGRTRDSSLRSRSAIHTSSRQAGRSRTSRRDSSDRPRRQRRAHRRRAGIDHRTQMPLQWVVSSPRDPLGFRRHRRGILDQRRVSTSGRRVGFDTYVAPRSDRPTTRSPEGLRRLSVAADPASFRTDSWLTDLTG